MKALNKLNKENELVLPVSSTDLNLFKDWVSEKSERMVKLGADVSTKEDVDEWLKSTDGVNNMVLMYVETGIPKGYIIVKHEDTEVYEWKVYLEPEVEDLKIGVGLLNLAIERLKSLGAKFIKSNFNNSESTVVMLHSKLGFRFLKEEKNVKHVILPLHNISSVAGLEASVS